MKINPHPPIYHIPIPKSEKDFFAVQKSLRVLKLLRAPIDKVLFRLLSDRVPLRVLSDRVSFESSVIDSSLGSSVLVFGHTAFSLSRRDALFCIIFSKKSSHPTISLTCSNICNKTDSKKMKNHLHDRDTKYIIENMCH